MRIISLKEHDGSVMYARPDKIIAVQRSKDQVGSVVVIDTGQVLLFENQAEDIVLRMIEAIGEEHPVKDQNNLLAAINRVVLAIDGLRDQLTSNVQEAKAPRKRKSRAKKGGDEVG